jgi:2-polyprenyl-3-methyl-5-hydroxy-6-metoxy-1,4-benzoquinol methylase
MKSLDRFIQRRRFAHASRYIGTGVRLLDVGTSDGALSEWLGPRVKSGVGVDPKPQGSRKGDNYVVLERSLPGLDLDQAFDVVTLLAVIEHIPRSDQMALAEECAAVLVPGGRLVATTPAQAADRVLDALRALRLIDGMELDEHYGFAPQEVPALFEDVGLRLLHQSRFELGLNHLFVFEKRASS